MGLASAHASYGVGFGAHGGLLGRYDGRHLADQHTDVQLADVQLADERDCPDQLTDADQPADRDGLTDGDSGRCEFPSGRLP